VATTFTLDASPSSDLEDPTPSLEVRWDWEDDATWDTPWSTTKTAQHQYPTVGTYTIRLELRDSGGMTDQAIRQVWVNNTAPTASFTVTPTSGDISTIFAVDASSSSDLEDATSALQVRWDWEDDGVWDTAWSTTKTAQHQYGSIGYYTIRLEVRDSGGLTNEITREVWVNSPPTASFTVSTVSGDITTLFAVDASASTDVEDPPAQLEVRWDWEDDGVWDTSWSTTKTAQHQYLTVGTYTIRLEVRDTGGLTNWAAAQVWVNNTPPAASFTVTPAVGDVSTLFIVDASLSSDLEDATPALEVRWDWEDDGTWDTAWSTTKTAQHQYGAIGAYIVRLGVRDTGGLSSQTTQQVLVNNTPPIASFAVAPLTGDISTTFTVDASSSSDLEDATSTLEVRWDWEDDGVWDTSWSTTKTAQHQYLSPGTYTIRLEARDAGGLADQTTRQVWVNNTPPTASFTISPPAGDISTTFTVDASSSTDLEDSASSLEVRWDWEDDGVWDTSWSTTKTAQQQYTALGVHTVRVEVRDIGGLSSQTTRQVWVNNTSPSVSFVASPSSGNISTLFTMDALASDLEDPPPQLEVRWDWEDDGSWDSPWSTTKTAQHQFATPGTYTIRVEVRDTGVLTSQTTRQVWVNNTAPVATFTMVPTAGNVTTAFLVDAAASSDLEDSLLLLEVRWDWEDDGVWDTSWSTTKTAQHQYPTVGTYTIRLEVRDSDGLSATATRQVSVLALPSPPAPPANLTAEPGDSEGSVRLTWTHPDPSEVHHYSIRVYDAVAAPAPIRTVDTTGGSPLAFTVTNLQPGKVYWFTVAAVDDAGRASDETGRVVGNAREGTEPGEEPSPEFPWWIILLLIVVFLAAILTFVLGRRRRKRRKPARRRLPPPPPDWSP
jgi:PKD repeat protein